MPLSFQISPYYDDYDPTKHYYRILFRPAVAVQARELTQSQTILQQQIKYIGDSIYQHGSMVLPGQIATDPNTNYVRLESTIGSPPQPINLATFTSQTIQGSYSGLQALVVYFTAAVGANPPTLYVKYLNTGLHGETAFVSADILSIVGSATPLAQVQATNPTGFAMSVQIDEGVYYIWGFFVRVEAQYLLLGAYDSIVSARVGLEIRETIVTSATDPSLNDNAQGSTNYAAPGANRYQIELILTSKHLTDTTNDENFVELLRMVNSVTQSKVVTDTYSVLEKELAQRMLDTNGDFAIRNFAIDIRESLDTSFVTSGTALNGTASSGSGAIATAIATTSTLVTVTFSNFGDNYLVPPNVTLTGGTGTYNSTTVTLSAGGVTAIVVNGASGYTIGDVPIVSIIPQAATMSLGTNASTSDGAYDNMQLYITNGTGAGQMFNIASYIGGTTKLATFDAFETYLPNQTADTTSTYTISDPTNINRGLYQPPPFGIGDAGQLAVGLESGRAYVDGYLINTLQTSYIPMEKARTTLSANGSVVPTPIGNYLLVKNVFNIPMPAPLAPNDFLTITFLDTKSTYSWRIQCAYSLGQRIIDSHGNEQQVTTAGISGLTAPVWNSTLTGTTTDGTVIWTLRQIGVLVPSPNILGTALVHSMEFYQGLNAGDPNAVFKLYVFDVNMCPGADIDTAKSFLLSNIVGVNDCGNSLNSYGDICTVFSVTNVNGGAGLVPGATIAGPNSGLEMLVSYDAINNLLLTEPTGDPTKQQILTSGQFTAPTTTGTIGARSQLFNTAASLLVYPLPQQLVETVVATNYYARQMFESNNSSGSYSFSISATPNSFSANPSDYMACVVASTGNDVGKLINVAPFITPENFSSSNTALTFSIPLGPGSIVGSTIKLMATVYKQGMTAKTKSLTSCSIVYASPTAQMSLQKADIVSITGIYDSGDPDITPNSATDLNILGQYVYDNGQRDYYYDIGSVALLTNAPGPSGQVLIEFTYFAQGSGDYFSVDSYQVEYENIPTYAASNGSYYPLRDCLDFRPRKQDLANIDADVAPPWVNTTTYTANQTVSYGGFTFVAILGSTGVTPGTDMTKWKVTVSLNPQFSGPTGTHASFSQPLSSTAVITADFQYFIGRIDKVYCDKYGNFNIIEGTPAIDPLPPADPLDGMMLYTIALNPYTLSTNDLTISATKNPRYTMQDIGKLEGRIANLEYYSQLSQLELVTSTTQVTDPITGLDMFKNGFITDNFTGHSVGNVFDGDYNCAVDPTQCQLRPAFVSNSNDLVLDTTDSTEYVNAADILMLPFTETPLIQQLAATDSINVNPFAIFTYHGDISLVPTSDTWYDTTQLPVLNVTDDSRMDNYKYLDQWSGTVWGDWQTDWVGTPTSTSTTSTTVTATTPQAPNAASNWVKSQPYTGSPSNIHRGFNIFSISGLPGVYQALGQAIDPKAATQIVYVNAPGGGTTTSDITTTINSSEQIGQTMTGVQSEIVASTTQVINNCLVGTDLSPYIRSRRIQVIGKHFKPSTQLYPFFDNIGVSAFCRPYCDPVLTPSLAALNPSWILQDMTWGGDYDPQTNQNAGTSSDAGDTGQTATGLLVGALNSAITTDAFGTVTLFFDIPCTTANEFRTGTRDFRLTSDPRNASNAATYGDANYTAAGIEDQNQETITSITAPEIETRSVSQSQVVTQNLGSTASTTSSTVNNPVAITVWLDPVAQSFLVKQNGGVFISSIDVFFQTADSSVPITMQIRNMVNGYPGPTVVPFSEKVLYPNNPTLSSVTAAGIIPTSTSWYTAPTYTPAVINTSTNGTVPTTFTFDCPVYLNDGTEYAFVLISDSNNYNVYTAIIGDTIIGTTNIVSTPPYLGNLFKSQNASTWVADPSQNLTFTIKMAVFDPTQTAEIYFTNSSVQADQLPMLPFLTLEGSNVVRVYDRYHMMPQGESVNSWVEISGVPPGIYNGITDAQLNGTFSIANVDLHSYTITVPGTAAISTGRVGPDGVMASRNYQFDAICPVINSFTPSGTAAAWSAEFISGMSVNSTQAPYVKDTIWTPLTMNTTTEFLSPRMIASYINESRSITVPFGSPSYANKSFILNASLSTTQSNLSPQVDLTRTSMILCNNVIDNPSFTNYTSDIVGSATFPAATNMDQGVTVTSGTSGIVCDSKVILVVIAVTGAPTGFSSGEKVVGAVSGATGYVSSWDSLNLTLITVTGTFQTTEAISGLTSSAIGTVQSFQYLNTITDLSGLLDFSVFVPGYGMTITDNTPNNYGIDNPVTILSVSGNQMTVDATPPFAGPTNYAGTSGANLTQYVRYVAESGPNGCTTASRYITRQFTLASASNSLQITYGINAPPGSFVDCYYRILLANSTQAFNTIIWQLATLDANVDDSPSSDPTQYKDYSYTINDIGPFTAFSVKLVFRGSNSSQIPTIRNFTATALSQ